MSFTAVSQLFNGSDIFIIPTFQRPYAWEKPQWEDLLRDLTVAAGKSLKNSSAMHYFSAIHTIRVDSKSLLLTEYVDSFNNDITELCKCNFITDDANYNVHIVVDGQQRLITLFALLECCSPSLLRRYVTLPSGVRIPKVILNPATDHAHWRTVLELNPSIPAPAISTRSQQRLVDMFGYFRSEPCATSGTPEHKFLMGNGSQLMWVELPSGATLAPFLTLNDRGKSLTTLEIVKSLTMETDENGSFGLAHSLHTTFGDIYRSIDQLDSFLSEDGFLRQLAIFLWEATGTVHKNSLDDIYSRFRTQFQSSSSSCSLVKAVVTQGGAIASEHTKLVQQNNNAISGTILGIPSFVNALFPNAPPRDASDDYQMVLSSLGLQPKQLAILLAVRNVYKVDWHQSLGTVVFSNSSIKKALITEYASRIANLTDDSDNLTSDSRWYIDIKEEIDSIPDEYVRDITPLYLAELLRIIVGNSKSMSFTSLWQQLIKGIPASRFISSCFDYLTSFDSRYKFIMWTVARNPRVDNQSAQLKHLLREFECCLPGGLNAHRTDNLDVEHFFPRDFSVIASISPNPFPSQADYEQNFVDRTGNKLLLDASLNRSIKNAPPSDKVSAYGGSSSVSAGIITQSSLQIANDLSSGAPNLNQLRDYVMLRQLRLAAFAAKRF